MEKYDVDEELELGKIHTTMVNMTLYDSEEEGYIVDVSVGLAYIQIEKWAGGRIHSRCTCHGVRFIHELQNLFQDITRQELKIQL